MKNRKRTAIRVVVFILAVVFTSWAMFYWFHRKPVRKTIDIDYEITSAAFRTSLNGLLGNPFLEGNKVETLVNGDEIFPPMLEAIRSAKKTITFETYIWSQGKICDEFKEALTERAKAGVQVLVVVDGMGSVKLKEAQIEQMRDAGIRFYKFNRDQWYKVNVQVNHRTHRKILIVDGKVGFIGGACLHDAWLGDAETLEQWRDTHFKIEGPAVQQLQGIFADNWRQTTGEVIHGPDFFPELEPVDGGLPVQSYLCGPKDSQETARLAFLFGISAAQKNIRISHAYFMPDELTVKTLLNARKRGVDIQVIVPGKLDSKIVKAASRSSWTQLAEAGVRFYEYKPAMLHVKEIIIDDVLVMAGSANFDNRSFRINDEANFNVLDSQFAAEQINVFERDKKECRAITIAELKHRSFASKAGDKFASLFSWQF